MFLQRGPRLLACGFSTPGQFHQLIHLSYSTHVPGGGQLFAISDQKPHPSSSYFHRGRMYISARRGWPFLSLLFSVSLGCSAVIPFHLFSLLFFLQRVFQSRVVSGMSIMLPRLDPWGPSATIDLKQINGSFCWGCRFRGAFSIDGS